MLRRSKIDPRPRGKRCLARLGAGYIESLEARLLLSDSAPVTITAGSDASDFTAVGPIAFFAANDAVHGRELWKTDGTAAGTVMVKDINVGVGWSLPTELTNVNGILYFRAFSGGVFQLWKSDGSAAGTTAVAADPNAGQDPLVGGIVAHNGKAVFSDGQRLYLSDGTAAGTKLITSATALGDLTSAGGFVYFCEELPATGTMVLFRTDGTTAGTLQVATIGYFSDSQDDHFLPEVVASGGKTYFTTRDAIFSTDGTAAGTVQLSENGSSTAIVPQKLADAGGTLFFNSAHELWQVDATRTGFSLVPNSSAWTALAGSTLYFSSPAYTFSPGVTHYRADSGVISQFNVATGVPAPTVSLIAWNGNFYQTVIDGPDETQALWRIAPDFQSAVLLSTTPYIGPTDARAPGTGFLTAVSSAVVFGLPDPDYGIEPWATDGTSAGTALLRDINASAADLIRITGASSMADVWDDQNNDGAYNWSEPHIYVRSNNGTYTFYMPVDGPTTIYLRTMGNIQGANGPLQPITLNAVPGQTFSGCDFTVPIYSGVITGRVVADLYDDNPIQNDTALADWQVVATDGTNTYTAYTNDGGYYTFGGLPTRVPPDMSTYLVNAVPPAGWIDRGVGHASVSIKAGQVAFKIDLGLRPVPEDVESVSGFVFHDLNQNGIRDAGEAGIPGAVYLDFNDNGSFDSLDRVLLAAADGSFTIPNLLPGTYVIRVQSDPGWHVTSDYSMANAVIQPGKSITNLNLGFAQDTDPVGKIGGVVFIDTNGNSTQEGGELPLVGVKVYLDSNNNGKLDAGELSALTNSSGFYSFVNLPDAGYRVRAVPPAGMSVTSPAAGYVDVPLFGQVDVSAQNIGIRLVPATASISGLVFKDTNADGTRQASESVASGWRIFLDANNNGKLDTGEIATLTDATGAYRFANLAPGTYHVAESTPAGWRTTSLASLSIMLGSTNATGKNFAVTQKAAISGIVFNDANGNAKQDAGEKGFAGATVYIDTNKNGKLDAGEQTFITAADGSYHVNAIAAGAYRLRTILPSGWRLTLPTAGYYDLTLAAGQIVSGKSFGRTQTAIISGVAFLDANSNARQDAGEAGLAAWTVYIDSNNNGKLDAGEKSVKTAANGAYSFIVAAGTYVIRIVQLTGYHRTAPTAGLYKITASAGSTNSGRSFGELH